MQLKCHKLSENQAVVMVLKIRLFLEHFFEGGALKNLKLSWGRLKVFQCVSLGNIEN